jgi:hypothetical protein
VALLAFYGLKAAGFSCTAQKELGSSQAHAWIKNFAFVLFNTHRWSQV